MLLTRALWTTAFLSLATAAWAEPATFALTGENTKIEFVGSKKDGSHTGGFKRLAGAATLKDAADPATLALNVTIETDSLFADDPKLTGHLKAPDFFEVKRFPEAKFVTTSVAKAKEGYTVTGDLTLHGVTKPVTFPAAISAGADGLKLSAKFTIDRTLWGMAYGKGQINDAVALSVSVAAKK